jgi:hypothetical protein
MVTVLTAESFGRLANKEYLDDAQLLESTISMKRLSNSLTSASEVYLLCVTERNEDDHDIEGY